MEDTYLCLEIDADMLGLNHLDDKKERYLALFARSLLNLFARASLNARFLRISWGR
jgi:hypothetical protein